MFRASSGLGEAETKITRLQEAFLGRQDSVSRGGSTMGWCGQGGTQATLLQAPAAFPRALTSPRTSVSCLALVSACCCLLLQDLGVQASPLCSWIPSEQACRAQKSGATPGLSGSPSACRCT